MLPNNIIVSVFKNYRDTIPKKVNLWEWLKDDRYKADIEYLRTFTDKDRRKEIKETLPCITASGEFSERKASGLKQHSHLICIDIDGQDNPQIENFDDLRDEISRCIVNVAYCSLSASGKGVFCLIPIQYPDKHKLYFDALKFGFSKLGITIDKNCGDVSRLRGYSYDSNAYLNMNAVTFTQLGENNDPSPTSILKTKFKSNFTNQTSSIAKVMMIVSNIEKSVTDITQTYQQWFQIGCALANEFGEEGRGIFHSVSQYNEKYSFTKTDRLFTDCLDGNYLYNIGTFFYWAEQYNLL